MSKINAYGLASDAYAKLYGAWRNMINRCYDEKNERFYTYGERGIRVCESWKTDFHSFARWALENGWEPSLSIERKDVDGMYCPENCTLITMREQMRNKTNNVRIAIKGEEKCLTEWCEIFGVDFKTVWSRYKVLGITDKESLFYPGDLREIRNPDILQFTLDGMLIAKHSRITEAANKSGMSVDAIRRACQGKTSRPSKYVWRYEAVVI